jgi:hypothetical protein
VYNTKKQKRLLIEYNKKKNMKNKLNIKINNNLNKNKLNKCNNYKQASDHAFNHYSNLAQGQVNYLNSLKKKFKKRNYLRILRRKQFKNNKFVRKVLRSEPFPLFFSNYFKNLKDVFKQVKIKKPKKLYILSYNRILKINRIYDKLNKKYYYNTEGKLKKIKKKIKKKFKIKFNL